MSKSVAKVVNLYEYKSARKEKEIDREQLLKLIKEIMINK
jgi:hypothetical protein